MRLNELYNKPIVRQSGERLGRVHEVHVHEGRITALQCGPASLIERLTGKRAGKRIKWEDVVRIRNEVVVKD
ncbi:MAG: hypothetical protein JWN69_1572 [Alphaproteobacteria bacterium]|nr:hypothetical protein [Alphaproteobacteria bacterium]